MHARRGEQYPKGLTPLHVYFVLCGARFHTLLPPTSLFAHTTRVDSIHRVRSRRPDTASRARYLSHSPPVASYMSAWHLTVPGSKRHRELEPEEQIPPPLHQRSCGGPQASVKPPALCAAASHAVSIDSPNALASVVRYIRAGAPMRQSTSPTIYYRPHD